MPGILITGASSGIGAALARRYAAPGTRLTLLARDAVRLEAVTQACRDRGATVEAVRGDVRDRAAMAALVAAIDAREGLDLAIVNAAVNGGHPAGAVESTETAFETMEVNVAGALNVMLPALERMLARGRGQIALMSSLAAYAPLPDAPAYSGAKAALLAHGLALREKVRARGVRVSVVTPGYVRTPMGGDYQGWRPLEMSAEAAAERIARGLARDRGVIAFPLPLAVLAVGATLVPEAVRRAAMRGFRFRIGRP